MDMREQAGFITGSPAPTEDERTWGMIAHLSALLLSVFGPLLVMVTKGKESLWVERQAKEAINFQLTMLALSAVIFFAGFLLFCVGGFLLWKLFAVLAPAVFVVTVYAGIKANEGVLFRYPGTIRLLK
jgi:hypothetical protein